MLRDHSARLVSQKEEVGTFVLLDRVVDWLLDGQQSGSFDFATTGQTEVLRSIRWVNVDNGKESGRRETNQPE